MLYKLITILCSRTGIIPLLKFKSKMNPRFLAEEVGGMGCVKVRKSDELMILEICSGSKFNQKKISFGRIKGQVVK